MNNEGATDEDQNTTTESVALAEIVAWSQDCPSWQRDALRRLCTADTFEADDYEQLLGICKGQQTAFVPLGVEHVPDPEAGEAVVTLRALYGIKNVNLLKEGEKLTFDKTGVTVVYGDNGSGKSGYARVLKKLCRARSPRNDVIVPSIYARSSGPAEATTEFAVGGQNRTASWVDGRAPDAMLSAVSVFDSRTANVHVDNTNDVAYTPLPLKMLASLAAACQELKNRLKAEIDAIGKQTPAVISNPECGGDTAVGKLLKQLNGGTAAEVVETLATLSAQEKAQLARLNTELAGDPVRTARHMRQCKNRIDELVLKVESLRAAASDARRIALRDLRGEAVAAKEAALLASTTLFAGEPLKGIGSETWAVLWEAARTYSAAEAYLGRTFPVLSDDARCVLCQQELDGEARSRLGRFEHFVRDDSSRRADAADNAYSDALKEARAAAIAQAWLRPVVALIDEELGESDLAARTRETLVGLLCRLRWIVRHHDAIEPTPLPDLAEPPVAELQSLSARLEARAATLLSDRQTPAMKALISERDELAAREWLHGIKADVLAQIARLKDIAALQTAEALTTTNRITSKSTELAKWSPTCCARDSPRNLTALALRASPSS